MRPSRTVVVAVACAGTAVVGCGSAASSTQANGARLTPTVSLAVTLTVTAPFPLTLAFTDTVGVMASAATCADAAAGIVQDGQVLVPPRPPEQTRVAGADGHDHAIGLSLHVSGYHGPAAYPSAAVVGDAGPVLVLVDGVSYGTAAGGSASVTVTADGGGRLVLDRLTYAAPPATPTPPASPGASPTPVVTPVPTPPPGSVPPLSASLAWTCTQLRPPTPGTPSPGTASPGGPGGAPMPTASARP